jgi:hypothetical protein
MAQAGEMLKFCTLEVGIYTYASAACRHCVQSSLQLLAAPPLCRALVLRRPPSTHRAASTPPSGLS